MKIIDPRKAEELASTYLHNWEIYQGKQLRKRATFSDYNHAVRFLLAIEKKQTEMDHFIDVVLFFDEMLISIHTHDVGALTKDDFKLAAYIDRKLADMDVE